MQDLLTGLAVTAITIWAFYPSKDCKCNDCNCYLKHK
jgi:hypothetical protein